MEPVHYGIIGFGGIAEQRIAKEGFCLDKHRFLDDPAIRLTGASDIHKERKDAASALGIRWFDTFEDMLENRSIDAVYIASSNSTHYALAKQALLTGKHVLMEKPMTVSLEEARDLVRIAHEQRLSLSVNLMMAKNSYNQKAQSLIASRAVGELEHLVLHMEFSYGEQPAEAASWRCSDPKELGGPIADVGSHCMHMAEFLTLRHIRNIRCSYYPPTLDIAVENGAIIQFELDGGLKGTIRAAFNQPRGGIAGTLYNLGYELYCSDGVIRGYGTMFQISGHSDEPIRIRLETETAHSHDSFYISKPQNIYHAQIREHAQSIRNDAPLNGSEGLRNLRLILACHESARAGGREIAIEEE